MAERKTCSAIAIVRAETTDAKMGVIAYHLRTLIDANALRVAERVQRRGSQESMLRITAYGKTLLKAVAAFDNIAAAAPDPPADATDLR